MSERGRGAVYAGTEGDNGMTSGKWETSMAQYALLSEARKRADALVKRRGGRRRARDLDDVSRAAAMARLAELSGATEGMAMRVEGAA